MLTKTVNGVTSNFAYTNTQWQDQLTSVNGDALSYDANGNLVSYDGKTYTWSHGKWLESVTDGENVYSYEYDSNGIRASKNVNGVETSYNTLNGKILSQFDATNEIYFQYSNDAPIGFVLNDTQYFYITNLNGDIVGITDSNGELIAEYSYNEWGKLLSITTAQENNAEQLAVAEINPLRYRGYYYDNETGMYYLQSRYYDPELCRFISADDFAYINTDTPMSVNAYAYCINNPLIYSDSTGHDFEWDFVFKLLKKLFIIDFVFPEFRYVPKKTSTTTKKISNWVSEAGEVIGIVINEIFVCLDLQEIKKNLKNNWDIDINLNFNTLTEYMSVKANAYKEWFDHSFWTATTDVANDIAGYVSSLSDFVPKWEVKAALKLLPYVTSVLNDFSGRYLSSKGGLIMMLYDWSINIASGILGKNTSFGDKILENIMSIVFGKIFDIFGNKNIEILAYNWYLM